MTLADFLLARIAEDEAGVIPEWQFGTPSRVLAECDAKRQIVDMCGYHLEFSGDVTPASDDLATATLHFLALPYADHPDYREEWRA